MKKFYIMLVMTFFLFPAKVFAQDVKVLALERFSTESPSSSFRVQAIEKAEIYPGIYIEEGTIISGCVFRVEGPKRLKRDGFFEILPERFIYKGIDEKISLDNVALRVVDYQPIDTKKLAVRAAKTVSGIFVKGASQGISFAQGVAQAEDGERLKSGFVKMYKDSPLVYIEEGDEMVVDVGDILILKPVRLSE